MWKNFPFELQWNSAHKWWDIDLNTEWELRRKIEGLSSEQVCNLLERSGAKLKREGNDRPSARKT